MTDVRCLQAPIRYFACYQPNGTHTLSPTAQRHKPALPTRKPEDIKQQLPEGRSPQQPQFKQPVNLRRSSRFTHAPRRAARTTQPRPAMPQMASNNQPLLQLLAATKDIATTTMTANKNNGNSYQQRRRRETSEVVAITCSCCQ